MFKIIAAATFAVVAIAVAGLWSDGHRHINCDGYGHYCAYDVTYDSKPFVRNRIEADTANRAKQIVEDMTAPPHKFQDRIASNRFH